MRDVPLLRTESSGFWAPGPVPDLLAILLVLILMSQVQTQKRGPHKRFSHFSFHF